MLIPVLHGMPQVVMTTIEPSGSRPGMAYDAYEYIQHSHTYMGDSTPIAKFTYDLSPIQVGCTRPHKQVCHAKHCSACSNDSIGPACVYTCQST